MNRAGTVHPGTSFAAWLPVVAAMGDYGDRLSEHVPGAATRRIPPGIRRHRRVQARVTGH